MSNYAHIDALLNQASNQVSYDDSEPSETRICPLCGGVLQMWYVTVTNSDGDYLDSLISFKHPWKYDTKESRDKCEFEQFEEVRQD